MPDNGGASHMTEKKTSAGGVIGSFVARRPSRKLAIVSGFMVAALVLSAEDRQFSLSAFGVGPFPVHAALTFEGGGERLVATAKNESGTAIQHAKICIRAFEAASECLFELSNTALWAPGVELNWNLTTAKKVAALPYYATIEQLDIAKTPEEAGILRGATGTGVPGSTGAATGAGSGGGPSAHGGGAGASGGASGGGGGSGGKNKGQNVIQIQVVDYFTSQRDFSLPIPGSPTTVNTTCGGDSCTSKIYPGRPPTDLNVPLQQVWNRAILPNGDHVILGCNDLLRRCWPLIGNYEAQINGKVVWVFVPVRHLITGAVTTYKIKHHIQGAWVPAPPAAPPSSPLAPHP
jgi:hypothetical protein